MGAGMESLKNVMRHLSAIARAAGSHTRARGHNPLLEGYKKAINALERFAVEDFGCKVLRPKQCPDT